ncbi:MAG: hypothetical protein ACTS8S_11670 [Giesbergeria sp.]
MSFIVSCVVVIDHCKEQNGRANHECKRHKPCGPTFQNCNVYATPVEIKSVDYQTHNAVHQQSRTHCEVYAAIAERDEVEFLGV